MISRWKVFQMESCCGVGGPVKLLYINTSRLSRSKDGVGEWEVLLKTCPVLLLATNLG